MTNRTSRCSSVEGKVIEQTEMLKSMRASASAQSTELQPSLLGKGGFRNPWLNTKNLNLLWEVKPVMSGLRFSAGETDAVGFPDKGWLELVEGAVGALMNLESAQ